MPITPRSPAIKWLAMGGLPALVLGGCAPVAVMGEGMSALSHELGHALVSNFFGRFAVPAVVITIHFEQSRLAALAIWAVLAFFVWTIRGVKPWFGAGIAAVIAYPLLAFTSGYDLLTLAMGHGAEILVAAWFVWRAARGGMFHDWERPLYAFFATYVAWRNVKLFAGIVLSPVAAETYRSVSFTGDNDFVRISDALHVPLALVCAPMALLALALPIAAGVFAMRVGETAAPDEPAPDPRFNAPPEGAPPWEQQRSNDPSRWPAGRGRVGPRR